MRCEFNPAAVGLRLIYRLAQPERGRAYNVTVLMVGDEPVWTVQSIGKVENGHDPRTSVAKDPHIY